jgi:hypothetical protein
MGLIRSAPQKRLKPHFVVFAKGVMMEVICGSVVIKLGADVVEFGISVQLMEIIGTFCGIVKNCHVLTL